MDFVRTERRGAVGVAYLNRPAKLNAISAQLADELIQVIDEYEADDEVRAIVLAGAGNRAFSSGADMTEQVDRFGAAARRPPSPPLAKRVRECRKPVLAAIRGYCYGGAAILAINCDIRVCGDDAKFRFVGASYGLAPGGAMLPRIVGEAKAKELLFTTDVVDAAEALWIGLANHVVPAAAVIDHTVAMAERIAANSPRAVMALKQIVNAALPVDEALARESDTTRELMAREETASRFRAAADRVVGARQS
ncbi:MAG TPA: enoyl-CoA hydratase/isomerase family protein [Chloroflexota bacterium]|nr:enoyl-CoA hydratase/isomerase family protein [Chloroflexota bacterium]